MLSAAGPSSLAVGLFVGTYVTTLAAAFAAAGFVIRYVGGRFGKVDDDNQTILNRVARVEDQIPLVTGRVKSLERGHKRTREILDRMSWVLESQEVATQDAREAARARPSPQRRPPGTVRRSGATET